MVGTCIRYHTNENDYYRSYTLPGIAPTFQREVVCVNNKINYWTIIDNDKFYPDYFNCLLK